MLRKNLDPVSGVFWIRICTYCDIWPDPYPGSMNMDTKHWQWTVLHLELGEGSGTLVGLNLAAVPEVVEGGIAPHILLLAHRLVLRTVQLSDLHTRPLLLKHLDTTPGLDIAEVMYNL